MLDFQCVKEIFLLFPNESFKIKTTAQKPNVDNNSPDAYRLRIVDVSVCCDATEADTRFFVFDLSVLNNVVLFVIKMNKFLSAFLSGIIAAFIFIILRPKLGGWSFVIVAVLFPIIFWFAQAVMDLFKNLFERKKK